VNFMKVRLGPPFVFEIFFVGRGFSRDIKPLA
jgi:hypothetical protein